MKATGIVRRIDDLGRVVIPKEIRRTMRIREGDPLEIFTNTDGEVVFKKYSPIGELSPFAAQYADVLSRATGQSVLICDRDHVVACAGVPRKEFADRRVSRALEELMESRRTHVARAGERERLQPVEGADRFAAVAAPILAAGDITGAVCLLLPETGAIPGESDIKLVQVAAAFLGKQMEE
ncbi:MAG: AbrB/MazE/SpoVT family DNA-binding domain-containing protein [Clostridia bacterium]|nr:AbrB/MazE/SpoVT family DNA-binding domain-containing protein [Clostridia bacterium]